ncbi:MAG: metallophosphoesterase [Pseudomonadota bacterium]
MNSWKSMGTAFAAASALLVAACTEAPANEGEDATTDQTVVPSGVASGGGTSNGKFLHLSDIHFDPFADLTILQDLDNASIDKWESILDGGDNKHIAYGRHIDSNWALFKSALTAASDAGPYDYVLYTGDYLRHNFETAAPGVIKDPNAFAVKTVDFVNMKLKNTFKKTPIISALGNNDSGIGDYQLEPSGPFLDGIADEMPGVDETKAREKQFKSGGYYRIPHPTVAKHDFLVLSIYWSRLYDYKCYTDSPSLAAGDDQMTWLTGELAKSSNTVTLLMHIPPGVDGFKGYQRDPKSMWCEDGKFETEFETALAGSKGKLIGAYAGHTHMDEFRVLASSGTPYLAVRMNPSISPSNSNHPAFSVVSYDTSTGAMKDYTTIALTNAAKDLSPSDAKWGETYTFTTAYSVSDYAPSTMEKLATDIQSAGSTQQKTFGSNYASGANTPAEHSWDAKYFACALTELNLTDYNSCTG